MGICHTAFWKDAESIGTGEHVLCLFLAVVTLAFVAVEHNVKSKRSHQNPFHCCQTLRLGHFSQGKIGKLIFQPTVVFY